MTRTLPLLLTLVWLLPPAAAAGESSADRRRRVEQAQRMEQRLPALPVDLRMLGFIDREPASNCVDPLDSQLPCVEDVLYAAPPDAGLEAVKSRARLLDGEQQALLGRLLLWGLTDLAYRTNTPPSGATIAVDRGLWERGAGRLPSGESLWRDIDLSGAPNAGPRAATVVPERWLWQPQGEQTLCVPLTYQGAHASGPIHGGATRPEALVCADGFVSNFTDALRNHFPGQLFRMGRVEGGSRTRRTAAPNKGEQLLTEYLFVSGRHDAAPWSTRKLRKGEHRGIFRRALVASAVGEPPSYELFVDPRALKERLGTHPMEVGEAELLAAGDLLTAEGLPDLLDRGVERFVDRIGIRILGHATLEYNPTHVRTLVALAALRSPPPGAKNAEETAELFTGPNPGHRDRSSVNAEAGDEPAPAHGGPSGGTFGELSAQIRKIPNDLRWAWIERLFLRYAAAQQDPSASPEGIVRLDRCKDADCPNLETVVTDANDVNYPRSAAWQALRKLLLTERAQLKQEELQGALQTLRQTLSTDEATRASAQLLVLLFDESGVHPGRLLLHHLLTELSTTLNAGSAWDPEALEGETTGVLEEVLAEHGYPTVPLEARGEPANPLAVCGEPGSAESVKVLELDVLFRADAALRGALEPDSTLDERAQDAARQAAAWEVLADAAPTLPFVAVDAPGRNAPTVEAVYLLPPPADNSARQAVYRARWRVWSGWHLLWGVSDVRVAPARPGPVAAETWKQGRGLALRSAALCEDTTLLPADLEPTLLRAALLRGFAPAIPTTDRPPAEPEAPESVDDAEGTAGDVTGGLGDGVDKATELANTDPSDLAAGLSGEDGIASLFSAADDEENPVELETRTVAGQVRAMLLRRLQRHPRLTCPSHRTAGTPRDDADLDGSSELFGDCDDAGGEFVPSVEPQVYLVFDLFAGRLPTHFGPARSPYLSLSGRRHSGSVFAVSTIRSEDEALTTRHVLPDHRPRIQTEGRWARRTTTEMTLGFEAGWAPLDFLGATCNSEFDGPPSVTCVRDADNVLLTPDRVLEDASRVGFHGSMQILATTWDARYQRTGFDAGAEFGLNITLPGIWFNSTLERVPLVRPRIAGVFGLRALLLPVLRPPPGLAPWGGAKRSLSPRFGRAVLALRTGWSVTALAEVVEGGPLLEFTLGPAVRRPAGRFAAMTPYRPRAVLSGFVRGDAAFLIDTLEARLTKLKYRVTLTFGVHGSFAVGAKMAKAPEEPDLSGVESLKDLLENPPTIPGGG